MPASSEISHHNIFQVYLPPSSQFGEPDILEVFMEECYLAGIRTKNYTFKGEEKEALSVTLYLSFVVAANSLYHNQFDRTQYINSCIDNEFINKLLYISPVMTCQNL